jgi:DNA-directed RNA polymerase subunit RPC12/RpoP
MIQPGEYKCACCGGIFQHGWTEEEAKEEYKKNFGKEVTTMQDKEIVCDDCYKKLMNEMKN